ncbi:MAG: PQQ-binding-like beta-propeller repeat protein [Luteitalea sp.]|nr:PQQ-binding-like beta-propeller repeat protein [Luteitalea sp.]
MNIDQINVPRKPLRLWPGVVAALLQWLVWLLVPAVVPHWGGSAVLGGLFFGLIILVWWLFFSRAPWFERLGAIVLMVVAVAATSRLVHESIANGMMGMLLPIYAIPALSLALVAWAVASRRLSSGLRRASMVASILLACGVFTIIRTGGFTGDADSDLHWRWTPTPEERLLAQAGDEPLDSARGEPPARSADPAGAKTDADWPGFRGPKRDGIVRGVRIETDWSTSPPVEVWRQPIGPGWSSFAVRGDLVYTQEQRGDDEVVSCYRLSTGEPVWRHSDAVRFWESNGGAGPRATPTLSDGRVYTFGATGILNVLDADTGTVVWSRNAASDTAKKVPYWGFASSPLVVDDTVIVAAAGQLVAYDRATGDRRWVGQARGASYSSPHLLTIGGVAQILLLSGDGAISVAPAAGTVLWEHPWPGSSTIVQPALIAQGDVLVSANSDTGGVGMRRIAVSQGAGGWTAEERWTSRGLKPYFNDFVAHGGHAFGFDGSILACINLEDGTRKWKGGRYGHGQLVLLPDQDLLLVLSEDGELALVSATPDEFTEVARFPAMDSKTWNHPVLVGNILLVRNGEEMAAFRLSLAGG